MKAYDGNALQRKLRRMKPSERRKRLYAEIGNPSLVKDRYEEVRSLILEWWDSPEGKSPSGKEADRAFRSLDPGEIRCILLTAWTFLRRSTLEDLGKDMEETVEALARTAVERKIVETRKTKGEEER